MANPFDDISKLKIPTSELEENQQKLEAKRKARIELLPPRHKKGETFIKGPIPMTWVKEMLKLPASASQMSFVLWFLAGMRKTKTIKINLSRMNDFNISKVTAWRSIHYLEKANLISVDRKPGQKLTVTLLDLGSKEPTILS